MKRWSFLPVMTFLACVTIALHVAETAPQLRVSANHRYLEDTSGCPFFLVGDCPQNLPLKLAIPEFDDHLADCERKGFNLLWICIDGQWTASPTSKPPQDQRGALMMTNETQYQQPSAKATDLECRMQDYYAALGGGCGGQVYGAGWSADNWDYAGYRDNGGRRHTLHFMNLFRPREWWSLVPDYGHTLVITGYGTLSPTTMDYVGAAINPAGTLGMAYCPKEAMITADLSRFSGPVNARWYDPTDGAFRNIPGSPFSRIDKQPFRTPGANRAGDSDWVLVLEASR